jgi:hypothetical protein
MARWRTVLGYAGAVLGVVLMLVMPFVLFPLFTNGVAATGIRIDPTYSGGEVARTIERDGYRIVVNRPVHPRAPLTREVPFVQLSWTPVSALPAHVADEVDLDGDGKDDLVARFDVPRDPDVALSVDVTPLGGAVRPLSRVSRDSFSSLIARVGDRIVLRVPLSAR